MKLGNDRKSPFLFENLSVAFTKKQYIDNIGKFPAFPLCKKVKMEVSLSYFSTSCNLKATHKFAGGEPLNHTSKTFVFHLASLLKKPLPTLCTLYNKQHGTVTLTTTNFLPKDDFTICEIPQPSQHFPEDYFYRRSDQKCFCLRVKNPY